jgi:hypothetical protein
MKCSTSLLTEPLLQIFTLLILPGLTDKKITSCIKPLEHKIGIALSFGRIAEEKSVN